MRHDGCSDRCRVDIHCTRPSSRAGAPHQLATAQMQKDELVLQLLKIFLGVLFAAYFVWWSLAVLSRLPPQ
jgi:hypothetical protein